MLFEKITIEKYELYFFNRIKKLMNLLIDFENGYQ